MEQTAEAVAWAVAAAVAWSRQLERRAVAAAGGSMLWQQQQQQWHGAVA